MTTKESCKKQRQGNNIVSCEFIWMRKTSRIPGAIFSHLVECLSLRAV